MSDDLSNPDLWCVDCVVTRRKEHGRWTMAHADGCLAAAALDEMTATDRAWFERHPGAEDYWRPLMPGDLGVASLDAVTSIDGVPMRVHVIQMEPGLRARVLPTTMVFRIADRDGNESVAGMALARRFAATAMPIRVEDR